MGEPQPRLVLASGSPRRRELLAASGWTFEVRPADIDESPLPAESPVDHVLRLSRAKADSTVGELVLAADTTVDLDGAILGKPADALEAVTMLRALSGRPHQVHTAVAVRRQQVCAVALATTQVWFSALTDAEIERYVGSGEPLDKAGAYGIQGGAAGFVERIDGSVTTVIGLPMHVVRELLGSPPTGP